MVRYLTSIVLLLTATTFARPAPPTQPFNEATVYKSAAQIFRLIPEKILPRHNRDWNDPKLEVANEALQKVIGEKAELEIVVKVVKPDPTYGQEDDPFKYEIGAEVQQVGETPVWIWCFFREEQKETLAELSKGSKVRVSGVIWHCTIHRDRGNERSCPLDINLSECTVKKVS